MRNDTTTGRERPEFYEALGRTIRVLRTDRGISRRDLAERIGISYSYLAGIENGKKRPSSSVLLALAEALGLRSHELLGAAEERHDRSTLLQPAPPPPALAAPSRRRAWFHQREAQVEAPAPTRLEAMPEPDEYTDEATEHPNWFLNRIGEIAPRLTEDERRLVLETAERLARR